MLVNTVSLFGCISSAKLNWRKSEIITIGSRLGDQLSLTGGLVWKNGILKYACFYVMKPSFHRTSGLFKSLKDGSLSQSVADLKV